MKEFQVCGGQEGVHRMGMLESSVLCEKNEGESVCLTEGAFLPL